MGVMTQAHYELNGVVLTITPITPLAQRTLYAAAYAAYPEPDTAAYVKPLTGASETKYGAFTTNAKDDPAYIAAVGQARARREQYFIGLVLDTAVTVSDRAAFVAPYANLCASFKRINDGSPLGALLVSDFVTVLMAVYLEEDKDAGQSDLNSIMSIAQRLTGLTGEEIADGYAFFPGLALRRSRRANGADEPKSQDISPAQQGQD